MGRDLYNAASVISKFVYHCHILGYADYGMMANIVAKR
ncbi:multicopper oxidase domain-containing protein [Crenothrix sp.]